MLEKLDVTARILSQINEKSLTDKKYWSFRGRSKRTQCHALMQYPAMMVPEMQGELIDLISENDPSISSIYDPFVGSGTTLGEAISRGLDFAGTDINPLAILSCEVKSSPFYLISLNKKISQLKHYVTHNKNEEIDVDFPGRDKWFIVRVQKELCKIRRAILEEKTKWARKFFWVALSDTVRLTCNSRSSTYKLHIKQKDEIDSVGSPISIFLGILDRNFALREEQQKILKSKGLISGPHHSSKINLAVEDVRKTRSSIRQQYDLIVTSPPYGDNGTTVPYGQFSYLPLMWIDEGDISSKIDKKLLEATTSIDSAGLGGSRRDADNCIKEIQNASETYHDTYNLLKERTNENGLRRYNAFLRDLNTSLPNIVKKLKRNGYMLWTLGNRHIGGIEIPLNVILRELLKAQNCEFVHEIEREIPSKRMASRNRTSKTMTTETVLIMRKA